MDRSGGKRMKEKEREKGANGERPLSGRSMNNSPPVVRIIIYYHYTDRNVLYQQTKFCY